MNLQIKLASFLLVVLWSQNCSEYAVFSLGTSESENIKQFIEQEIYLNASALIESRGFLVEEHNVQTRDGYILKIRRILNPLVSEQNRKAFKPVILMHGLMGSAADWVVNSYGVGPKIVDETTRYRDRFSKSLGLTLANNYFDVWLGTMRGSKDGLRHVSLTAEDLDFWDFSQDEHIKYDLPAIIDYVLRQTGESKVGYVGHSHGSLMAFGLLSDKPNYNHVIAPLVALAPVALVRKVDSKTRVKLRALTTELEDSNGHAFKNSRGITYFKLLICGSQTIFKSICDNFFYMMFGFNAKKVGKKRYKKYISYMSAGTSLKTLVHYGQAVESGQFAFFQHRDSTDNYAKYGTFANRIYPIENIQWPYIHIFRSKNDLLSTLEDVNRLRAMHGELNQDHEIFNWNHFDYLYSSQCDEKINRPVLDLMNAYRILETTGTDSSGSV